MSGVIFLRLQLRSCFLFNSCSYSNSGKFENINQLQLELRIFSCNSYQIYSFGLDTMDSKYAITNCWCI